MLAWLIDSIPEPAPAPREHVAPSEDPSHSGEIPWPASERPRASPPAWAGALGIGLAGAVGVNPTPALGPHLDLQLRTPWRLALALGANYWPDDRVALEPPNVPGSTVSFRARQVDLALCAGLLQRGAWGLSGCLGGVLGARLTRGSGLAESPNLSRIYGGPSSAVQLEYSLSARWFATLICAGVAFGREDRFTYVTGDGQPRVLFRSPRLGGWSVLGLVVRL